MNNLLRFITRYGLFFVFLILQGICFYFIYQRSVYHQTFFNGLGNEVAMHGYNSYANVEHYFYLQRENDSLVVENSQLRKNLAESQYNPSFFHVSAIDTTTKEKVLRFTYIPAKIIRNSIDKSANYIYIDKGYNQGIKKQMGVITPNGIVGQVVDVTPNFAAVMSVLNKNFKAGAKLKNANYFGTIHWDGINPAVVRFDEIPKHVKVNKGDTVVSSGYSDLFPENIMIGRVQSINAAPEKNFLEIQVKLHADLQKLSYVYVVDNLMRNEIVKLDSSIVKIK